MCGTMCLNLLNNLTTQWFYLDFENLVYFTKYMKVYELFAEYDSRYTHPCFPLFLSEFAAEAVVFEE